MSYKSLLAEISRLRRAEQRLLKSALVEEGKLIKKLVAEEKRILRALNDPRPKKRRKRRTKAEMAAARAAALAANSGDDAGRRSAIGIIATAMA